MQYVQSSRNTRTSFFFIKDLPFSYHATKIIWVNYSKNKWERLYRSEDIRAVLTASCTKWWRCSRQLSVPFRLRNDWPGPQVPDREKNDTSKDARDWYNILNGVHRLNVHIYWDLIVPAICWYFFMPKNRGEYGEVRRLAKEQYEYGSNDSFLSSMLYYGYKTRVK